MQGMSSDYFVQMLSERSDKKKISKNLNEENIFYNVQIYSK